MCFSAEADLLAGAVVCAVGVDAIRHVRRPAERLLAAIPLVLGAHLLVEVLVWRGLHERVAEVVFRAAVWLYVAIAFAVLPVVVPLAVGALEPPPNRRRTAAFTTIGVVVAAMLMYSAIRGPVEAAIRGHHISYTIDLWRGGLIVTLYVVATCGSLLASHHRPVRLFGAINLVAVVLLAWLDKTAFISLWCAWAAITSVAIAVYLRSGQHHPNDTGGPVVDAAITDPAEGVGAD